MDRERVIALLENAEERAAGYVQKLLANADFRKALHRYDQDQNHDGDDLKRACGS